jgi:hypothetical protein
MKNLLLTFSSFHTSNDPNYLRENEYYICYSQLIKIIPSNYDLIFVDNTISSLDEIKNINLKRILNDKKYFIYNYNIGTVNKGMGELEMLYRSSSIFNFLNYDKICYLTGRRLITCPYIFEKTNNLNKDALLSNPPLTRIIDGYEYSVDKESYNDMFFAMKSKIINNYIKYAINFLNDKNQNIGSEKILYQFINENNISYEWLEYLGMIRNDWNQYSSEYNRDDKNFQFC